MTAIEHRQRKVAAAYGVTVEVLLAEILPQLAATACRRSASLKARSAAKKALWACGVDVAALTAQQRPKHTRAERSAANRRVASTIRKLDGHVSRPPRQPKGIT